MDIRNGRARKLTALLAIGLMFLSPGGLVGGLATVVAAVQTTTPKPTPTTTAKPVATPSPAPAGTRTAPPATTPATAGTQTAKPATTPSATPAAKPAPPPPPPPDGGWPRTYFTEKGARLIIYQPQIATWTDQVQMVAYSAVSYTPKGAPKQTLGTIQLTADTRVSVSERLVDFSSMRVAESNFPTLEKSQVQEIIQEITSIPIPDRVIALDRVLASVDKSAIVPKNIEGVKADPPTIFFSQTPARLVNIDGEPVWNQIKENDLKFAINTNWDLFEHEPTKTFYLRDDKTWLKATAIAGPWTPAGKLPESFKKLPKDDNFKEVRDAVPGKSLSEKSAPKIFVSQEPAEMILLKGPATYVPVAKDSQLQWVSNTDSDVFRMGPKGLVYYLVSGRWFSAPDFTGPWTFATTKLPPDFQKISLEHERSRVLASIPGTSQAAEAVLLASVPEKATVSRKAVKAPEVGYDGGKPEFKTIETTTVQQVVNTDKDIFKVNDAYYMCFQGVWFTSKLPDGPWEVADSIPKEIYQIPVSSSAHNVTYVTVEESNDDAVVFATAAAYTGLMIAWGCVVWGSGWYYPPYYGYGWGYPAYYGRYPSYGYSAWYNPWTGAYGRSMGVYGPYGGAGMGARYNPRTGTYARGAVAYGPNGARGVASAYNPRTGTSAATRQGAGTYGSWGQTAVSRGDSWATTSRVTNNRGTTTRVTQGSGGGSMVSRNPAGAGGGSFAGVSGSGDVYAGRDGNVYRKQGDSWQKYENGGWADQPSATPNREGTAGDRTGANRPSTGTTSTADRSQLDRDSRARSEGTQRTRDAGSVRSGTASRPTSYRPTGGGGMSRGGGGGRRR